MSNIEKLKPYTSIDDAYQGTHVLVLPSTDYPKKHWNKIEYVVLGTDNKYDLHLAGSFGNSKEIRLSRAHPYSKIFKINAIENVHFTWIEDSIVYNRHGEEINNFKQEIINK